MKTQGDKQKKVEDWKLFAIEKEFLRDIVGKYGEYERKFPDDYDGQFWTIQGDRIAKKEAEKNGYNFYYPVTEHTLSIFNKSNALVPREDLIDGFTEAIRKQRLNGDIYVYYLFFN